MNLSKSGQKAVDKYFRELMPDTIEELVALATEDLYNGPVVDNDDYPGFSKAVAVIASWWADEGGTVYLDTQTDTVLDERGWADEQRFRAREWRSEYKAALAEALEADPDLDEDEFEAQFGGYDEGWMSDWVEVDDRAVKQIIFGGELAGYI